VYEEYIQLRKLLYKPTIRGEYVKFIQHIHDLVRIGNVQKLSAPLSAYWSITNKCNLSCKHCYEKDHISKNKDLSLVDAKYIVDVLKYHNLFEVILQGGEPFCYQYICEIIEYLKKAGFALTILTNGTKIQNEKLDVLSKFMTPIDLLQVSLDGNQKVNDQIRGKNVYSQVINMLNNLKVPNVVVNCVVTDKNIDYLDEFVHDILTMPNVQELHFSPLMKVGNGKNFEYPDINKCIDLFKSFKQKSPERITGSMFPDYLILNNYKENNIDLSCIKLGCCAGRSKVYINPQGLLYSCEFRQIGEQKNILLDDFNSIWDNSWQDQISYTYKVSKSMKVNKTIEKFCPNLNDF
jgi:MoaA/NifB/PqqE/SkfB family radical SAM enzyme